MTKDELESRLLLLGFKYRDTSLNNIYGVSMVNVVVGRAIMVRFNTAPNKIGVTYIRSGKPEERRKFNTTPESAFNFIKRKLT